MIRFDRAMDALRRNDLGLYLIVGLLTVIATTTALELWDLRWNVPIGYSGDAILIASHIKTDLETGWYESQSLLGAPFGQVYHDWKSADNLHHMVVSAMRLFVHDWGVAINLYYLLGYLLAALTATWFLRLVGVSRTITVALAVLYGIAPYHFIRGEHHMWLSAYYPIPLALGVVYLIASGRPLWQSRAGRGRVLGALTGRGAFVAVALALVATANSYYGFFTVLLIALAGLIRLIADHDWRRFVGAVAAGVITAGVMLLNMLPDIVYSALHGSNAVAVGRLPVEAELYSLKFMQLVLPMPDHRVPILRSLRTLYDTLYPFTAESPALGIVAAVGFVSALGFTLYTLLARFRGGAAAWSPRRTAFGILSGLILFCFLLSTFGGLSSLVSFFTSDLRGWNRMSIVIAMLSLAATGLLVDALVGRIVRRYAAVRAFPVVAAATASALLLGVGYLDQVSPLRVPDYAATTAEYDADAEMVGRIEQLVPEGAMILQLPFRQFPETPPINGVYDTDQLKPYLHSDTLRWSGGAIKGRPSSEWPGLASVLPTDGFIRAVAAAGFSGVLVDRRPYEDDGRKIVAELREAIGEEAFSAQDGRYLFFELGDDLTDGLSAGDRADLGEWIVRPLYARFVPDYGRGFTIPETLGAYKPSILLDNPRDEPMRVRLDFTLAYAQGDAVLRFTAPDGSFTDLPVSADPDDVSIEVDAPPGRSTITVTVVEGPQPEKGRTNSGPIVVTELTGHDLELEAMIERIASER